MKKIFLLFAIYFSLLTICYAGPPAAPCKVKGNGTSGFTLPGALSLSGTGTTVIGLESETTLPTSGAGLFNFYTYPCWIQTIGSTVYRNRIAPFRVVYPFTNLAVPGTSLDFSGMDESVLWTVTETNAGTGGGFTVTTNDTEGIDYLITSPNMRIGTDTSAVLFDSFSYVVDGVTYTNPSEEVEPGAPTNVATGKWAATAFDIEGAADGTIDRVLSGDKAGAPAAVAALARPASGHVRVGVLLVKNETAGTLALGTANIDNSADDFTKVTYYNAAQMNRGDGYLLGKQVESVANDTAITAMFRSASGGFEIIKDMPFYISATANFGYQETYVSSGNFGVGFYISDSAGTNWLSLLAAQPTGSSDAALFATTYNGSDTQSYSKGSTTVAMATNEMNIGLGWILVEFYVYGETFTIKLNGTSFATDTTNDLVSGTLGDAFTNVNTWDSINVGVYINTGSATTTNGSDMRVKNFSITQTGVAVP